MLYLINFMKQKHTKMIKKKWASERIRTPGWGDYQLLYKKAKRNALVHFATVSRLNTGGIFNYMNIVKFLYI